jgi:arginyl-tRNA synthetase
VKNQLVAQIKAAVLLALPDQHDAIAGALATIELERPKQASHGDFACNIAMRIAKPIGKNPREVAQAIIAQLPASDILAKAEIAGPGFINFTLAAQAKFAVIRDVLKQAADYGKSTIHAGEKVMVEFVSANPTGPLHVGHGRQAALGDSICRLLQSQGYEVLREFYYNDAGNQIHMLTLSTQARIREASGEPLAMPENGYQGDYISEIARNYLLANPSDKRGDNLDAVQKFAVAALRHEQDLDLKAFDVQFDSYYLESSLYSDGKVDEVVKLLEGNGKTYVEDGATWLRTVTTKTV